MSRILLFHLSNPMDDSLMVAEVFWGLYQSVGLGIWEYDGGGKAFGLFKIHHGIGNNNDDISNSNFTGSGAVKANFS